RRSTLRRLGIIPRNAERFNGRFRWRIRSRNVKCCLQDSTQLFRKDEMIALKTPLFQLGRVVATPGAIDALDKAKIAPFQLISRHVAGDWGVVDAEDSAANNQAIVDGGRILSAYKLETGKNL